MLCRKLFENQRLRCRFLYSDLTSLKHPPSLPNSPQQHYEPIRTFATKSINETKDDPTSSIIQGTIPFHGKGLKMGQYAEVHRKFTQDDVNLFGRLSGDMNPVHFPTTAPEETTIQQESSSSSSSQHTQPIVHGILLSSLFSNIFGTLIPGAIYRHQSLKFHNVVHVNEDIVGRVVVTKLRQIHRKGRGSNNGGGGGGVLCTCDTSVIKMGDVTQKVDSGTTTTKDNNNRDGSKEDIVCISGDAQVWLPDLQLVYECREKGE